MAYTHDPNDITAGMTTSNTPSPNVVYESSYYGDYRGWKAFDHVAGEYKWLTFSLPTPAAPQWIKFDFGEGHQYNFDVKYIMVNQGSAAGVGNNDNPRDWLLQASNDDINWVTLDSQADITWVIDEVKEFFFSNSNSYRYLRLYITDYNPAGYNYLALSEFEILETPTALPADRLVQYRRTRRPGPVAGV